MPLHVLRKLRPSTVAELHDPARRIDFLYLDKNQPWFADRWVGAEFPRSQPISDAIRDGTMQYGIWSDEQGAIVKTFPDLQAAQAAKDGARVVLSVDVDIPDEAPRKGKAASAESGAAAV